MDGENRISSGTEIECEALVQETRVTVSISLQYVFTASLGAPIDALPQTQTG